MIRVILAEDHHIVRAAVAAFLQREEDIEVVGEVSDGLMLVETVERLQPDVIVVDAHMPGQKTIDIVGLLRKQYSHIRILVLSAYDRRDYVIGMLNAGATGYVLKDDPPQMLVQAIRAAARDQQWLSPRITSVLTSIVRHNEEVLVDRLTEREMEILRLIGQGLKNEQIVEQLSITEQTVKNHIRNIFSKIGVTSRVEAVLYAIKCGLVQID